MLIFKLTAPNGKSAPVNMNTVRCVLDGTGVSVGAQLFHDADDITLVKETPDEIEEMLWSTGMLICMSPRQEPAKKP